MAGIGNGGKGGGGPGSGIQVQIIHHTISGIPVPSSGAMLAQHSASLVADHRAGKHPWGSMRRDCPLCQRG